jgi:phosphoglycerate dehydrogenase-like enzyme
MAPELVVGVSRQPMVAFASPLRGAARLVPWDCGVALDAVWRRNGDSGSEVAAIVEGSPSVRWVHTDTVGVDRFPLARWRERGIRVSHAPGDASASVAEWVLAAGLLAARRLHEAVRISDAHRWAVPEGIRTISGSRVTVLGMGRIGARVARGFVSLGAQVTGVVRTEREDDPRVSDGIRLVGVSRLRDACRGAELLAICVPSTSATRGMVDAELIAELAAGAWILNAARGDVLELAALREARATGRLGGAVLDVLDVEPPGAEHAIWGDPDVVVTGHSADLPRTSPQAAAAVFVRELESFASHAVLHHEVDLEREY